jgi:hypothetical protein
MNPEISKVSWSISKFLNLNIQRLTPWSNESIANNIKPWVNVPFFASGSYSLTRRGARTYLQCTWYVCCVSVAFRCCTVHEQDLYLGLTGIVLPFRFITLTLTLTMDGGISTDGYRPVVMGGALVAKQSLDKWIAWEADRQEDDLAYDIACTSTTSEIGYGTGNRSGYGNRRFNLTTNLDPTEQGAIQLFDYDRCNPSLLL